MKYSLRAIGLLATASAASVLVFACNNPIEVDAKVDFSGRTIEWIIPFKEGGGSDRWARFYAPLLRDALPGRPTVVVRNMPGAGSTKGANAFAARARPDGLTILGTSGSTQFPYLLDDPRVRYEYREWKIVLASPTGGVVYVSPKLGVGSASEMLRIRNVELLYGSQGATSLDLVPLLAFELLGLNVNPIFGMKGRATARAAFERGETNIDYQTSSAYLTRVKPLVEQGEAVAMFSWGVVDADGNLVRDPTFPKLPHFAEVYETLYGEPPSGFAFDAWKSFFIAGFSAQKMVFLPGETSPEIVTVYSKALDAVIGAVDFPERSIACLGVYPQVTGDAATAKLEQAINVNPEAITWVKSWLNERFGVAIE